MTPHKVCPQCGQPAVLQMDQCRRCGFVYPGFTPVVDSYGRPLSPAALREVRRPAAHPRRRASTIALLASIAVIALAAIILARSAGRLGVPAARIADRGASPAAPLAGMRDPMAGMFVERESKAEMPTLAITNDDNDTMHLLLKDGAGRVFHLSAGAYETARLQIPTGRYDIAVTSDDPTIRPNNGDAVFRRYKEYSSTFVRSPDYGPIHLGD